MKPETRSPLRFLLPSILGVLLLAAVALVVAGVSGQSVMTASPPFGLTADGGAEDAVYTTSFSIGWPTWYESSGDGRTTSHQVHWLNILLFLAIAWMGAMPLGRLITEAARPLPAARIYAAVLLVVCLGAVLIGAGISRWYWGYWFSRPGVDWRVGQARSLERLTPIDNLDVLETDPLKPARLPDFRVRGGTDFSAPSRLSGSRDPDDYYTLHGRVLNALEDAGHDLVAAPQRTEAEVKRLYALVAGSGWLDSGSAGYAERAGTLTGYAIDFAGPREGEDDLLLLTLSSREVANDHFAYYELLFGPPAVAGDESTRPLISANRFYYDVAGVEGMEWWHISLAAGVLGLITLIPLTAALTVWLGTRRRNNLVRRGFAVEVAPPAP